MTQPITKKVIALFDFDGTITTKDSLVAVLLFNSGIIKCGLIALIYAPVHLLLKLKLINSTIAKNFLLPFFFRNITVSEFDNLCNTFCKTKLPQLLNINAIKKIQWHHQQKHEVVIVTASASEWIEPWATSVGIKKIIATKLEIDNNALTGRLAGKNCNDEEKLVRIKKEIPGIDEYEVYAYGNSAGDRFMLSIAQKKFYKKFE